MTEEQIQTAARKGFADQFRQCPDMLNKSLTSLTKEEITCLLIGICKEFMFAKKDSFSLNEAQSQAFDYVLQRIKDFIHHHECLTWLPFREWDLELVDEFVYVVYINFDYMYCKVMRERILADEIPY